jgi:hypothetical protein
MCDTCNANQGKVTASAKTNHPSNQLYSRLYRLEREIEEVKEAIKLVETDEAVKKVVFVTEQINKA